MRIASLSTTAKRCVQPIKPSRHHKTITHTHQQKKTATPRFFPGVNQGGRRRIRKARTHRPGAGGAPTGPVGRSTGTFPRLWADLWTGSPKCRKAQRFQHWQAEAPSAGFGADRRKRSKTARKQPLKGWNQSVLPQFPFLGNSSWMALEILACIFGAGLTWPRAIMQRYRAEQSARLAIVETPGSRLARRSVRSLFLIAHIRWRISSADING